MTRKTGTQPSEIRPRTDKLADNISVGLAISTAKIFNRLQEIFSVELNKTLEELVPPEVSVEHPKRHLKHRRVVTSPLAHDVMSTIWVTSEHVTPEAKRLAGLSDHVHTKPLTKNGIVNLIIHSVSTTETVTADRMNALRSAVLRTLDALEYFGMINVLAERSNYRRVEGTQELHQFMTKVNTNIAQELQSQLDSQ